MQARSGMAVAAILLSLLGLASAEAIQAHASAEGTSLISNVANGRKLLNRWREMRRHDPAWGYAESGAQYAYSVISSRPDLQKSLFGRTMDIVPNPFVSRASVQSADNQHLVILTLIFGYGQPVDVEVYFSYGQPQWLKYKGEAYSPRSESSKYSSGRDNRYNSNHRVGYRSSEKWIQMQQQDKVWKFAEDAQQFAWNVFSSRTDLQSKVFGSAVEIFPTPNIESAWYTSFGGNNQWLVKIALMLETPVGSKPVEVKILFANGKPQWMDLDGEQYSPGSGRSSNQGGNSNSNSAPEWTTLSSSDGQWTVADNAAQFAVQVISRHRSVQKWLWGRHGVTNYQTLSSAAYKDVDGNTSLWKLTIIVNNGWSEKTVETEVLLSFGKFQWARLNGDEWSL